MSSTRMNWKTPFAFDQFSSAGLVAHRDRPRHLDEPAGDRPADGEVAVVVDRRDVRLERPERAGVVPDGGRAVGAVEVELRARRSERVVAREHDRMAVARDRDAVLVVVPAHAVDRLVGTGLHVVGDDDAGLLGLRAVRGRRRPRRADAVDDVRRLLVREDQVALEALLLAGEEVRAEALVVRLRRDHVRALEDAVCLCIDLEVAEHRVREVVEPDACRRRERERDGRRLVVHVHVGATHAVADHRDPVGDRFEHVAVLQRVADRDDRLDRHAAFTGVSSGGCEVRNPAGSAPAAAAVASATAVTPASARNALFIASPLVGLTRAIVTDW